MRALEWRARRFSDPADRLQYLRRKLGVRPVASGRGMRAVRQVLVVIIALGAMLPAVAWFWTSSRHVALAAANTTAAESLPARPVGGPAGPVWLVQTTPQFDLYSNGLRIEEQYATSTAARRYIAFARDRSGEIDSAAEWRTEPAGIVYHTTESHLAPFEENQNQSLRRSGEGLLQYVSRRRSYHFVIDRFGRVFRVVRESDYANHAGNSVWADQKWIYLNLNQSFFGVAFEARSKSNGNAPINAAQVYAGRVLTEMLRARYAIPGSNCVAHAQVSVNPANHGVGYHLDWAASLPFAEFGLSDNYKLALPSVQLFGFEPPRALKDAGASSASMLEGMAEGWEAAETELRADGAAQNLPLERYREKLRKRYRDAIRALRGKGAYQEYN